MNATYLLVKRTSEQLLKFKLNIQTQVSMHNYVLYLGRGVEDLSLLLCRRRWCAWKIVVYIPLIVFLVLHAEKKTLLLNNVSILKVRT